MNDLMILNEAVRLVEEGRSVTLPVDGRSMRPFIIGGRESVVLQQPEALKVGDVVLAWVENRRYVVHRIIRLDGEQVTLMGDGNIRGVEQCQRRDIRALATHVVDASGQRHDLYAPWRRRAARLWWWLRPIRRYLLYIFKKVKGLK